MSSSGPFSHPNFIHQSTLFGVAYSILLDNLWIGLNLLPASQAHFQTRYAGAKVVLANLRVTFAPVLVPNIMEVTTPHTTVTVAPTPSNEVRMLPTPSKRSIIQFQLTNLEKPLRKLSQDPFANHGIL